MVRWSQTVYFLGSVHPIRHNVHPVRSVQGRSHSFQNTLSVYPPKKAGDPGSRTIQKRVLISYFHSFY